MRKTINAFFPISQNLGIIEDNTLADLAAIEVVLYFAESPYDVDRHLLRVTAHQIMEAAEQCVIAIDIKRAYSAVLPHDFIHFGMEAVYIVQMIDLVIAFL